MISKEQVIREAFDLFSQAACKVKEGSDQWVDFVARASTLGWVLEIGVYTENVEVILRELRKVLPKVDALDR